MENQREMLPLIVLKRAITPFTPENSYAAILLNGD
jgi:hypothetical protein